MSKPSYSRYDHDPDALAWARSKVHAEIDRARKFALAAQAVDDEQQTEAWRRFADHIQRAFIGGEGCVIARFDERLPVLAKSFDGPLPMPADQAAVMREVADRLAIDAEQGQKEGFTRVYQRAAAAKVRGWADEVQP
ncbi:hypothetical protein [Streptomyces prunicolor]|uniref:hypothetical protein n=1 Tax=Streptomyces prunicolor TaxID=67348 RepID=UPI0033CEB1C9